MKLSNYIDHTLLKPEATLEGVENLCNEALQYNFAAVCVNPVFVERCAKILDHSKVAIATVVGFPLGANTTSIKTREAWEATNSGATEIDMVLSVGLLKSGQLKLVERDISEVVRVCEDALVKVILETCLLSESEIVEACKISMLAGATFVKTSTGFSTGGATVEVVRLMKKVVGDKCKVKASGGVKTREAALAMIEAGASRIGTSSGVAIVKG